MNNHHLLFSQDCIEFGAERNDLENNYSRNIIQNETFEIISDKRLIDEF